MESTLSGKRILLVVGGGIAAYKALDLIRRLRERGAAVTPILTTAGAQFVTPLAAIPGTGPHLLAYNDTGRVVHRIEPGRHGVTVDAQDPAAVARWWQRVMGGRVRADPSGCVELCEVPGLPFDGIVFASDKAGADFVLTPKDVFLALAKDVVVDGKVVPNTAAKWKDVNPALPDQDIMAFIPGTKHGTREVFEEKVLIQGCKDTAAHDALVAAKGEDEGEAACKAVRADGKSVDIDGDYTETLARLGSSPEGVGVFGLSFYDWNLLPTSPKTFVGGSNYAEVLALPELHTALLNTVVYIAAFFVFSLVLPIAIAVWPTWTTTPVARVATGTTAPRARAAPTDERHRPRHRPVVRRHGPGQAARPSRRARGRRWRGAALRSARRRGRQQRLRARRPLLRRHGALGRRDDRRAADPT